MKTLIYSAKDFEIPFIEAANNGTHAITYSTERLTTHTAMMALGYKAISIFSGDDASPIVLEKLKDFGVEHITLRSAGHDNVNLHTAAHLKIQVANAPDYSPNAVAEHAVGLLLALNRKITLSRKQTQQYDFRLSKLVGFDLVGKTVGVVGTGRIGSVIVRIMSGFGCNVIATDPQIDATLVDNYKVNYCDIDSLCFKSDIIFLSLPLTTATHQLIDASKLTLMHKEVLLINVARGGVVETQEVIDYVTSNRIGGYATDVYDKESGVFSYNRSDSIPEDKVLEELLQNDRMLLTPHQAFATREALHNIASTTIENLNAWQKGATPASQLTVSIGVTT